MKMKTMNLTVTCKIDTKGCSLLLSLFIWHLKAYAFFHSLLAKLRLRNRTEVVISVKEHKIQR